LGDDGAGFLSGGDKGAAGRDACQQCRDVGGGDDLQECVGGVVFQPPDLAGGVVEGQPFPGAELPNRSLVKPLLASRPVFCVKISLLSIEIFDISKK